MKIIETELKEEEDHRGEVESCSFWYAWSKRFFNGTYESDTFDVVGFDKFENERLRGGSNASVPNNIDLSFFVEFAGTFESSSVVVVPDDNGKIGDGNDNFIGDE